MEPTATRTPIIGTNDEAALAAAAAAGDDPEGTGTGKDENGNEEKHHGVSVPSPSVHDAASQPQAGEDNDRLEPLVPGATAAAAATSGTPEAATSVNGGGGEEDEEKPSKMPSEKKRKRASTTSKKGGTATSASTKPPKKKRTAAIKKQSTKGEVNGATDDVSSPNDSKKKSAKPNKKPQASTTKKEIADTTGAKVDGRTKNKGASKRESYSVAFKAKMVRDYETWEAAQPNGKASVRDYVQQKNLGQKYEKFLSACGWREPKTRERILDDAARSEYQHMARMPDRTKNKSYYAEMEEALEKRLEERRAQNLTVSTQTIRDLAREELRRLTNNDEEKVNAFKASNGWVFNFLRRAKRKAKDLQLEQQKNNKKQQKEQKHKEKQEQIRNNNSTGDAKEKNPEATVAAGTTTITKTAPTADPQEEDSVMINWDEINAAAAPNSVVGL